MDIREYIKSSYELLKKLFASAGSVQQSILIGAVREYIVAQVLRFFPEPIRSGWIYDEKHNHTGQIDLILSISKALIIPGLVVGDSLINGVFAQEVFAALEVKSGISSSMPQIMQKTWECHRLLGGFGNQTNEKFADLEVDFQFNNWVPLCVIGSDGFATPDKYQEHFEKFNGMDYSINKNKIEVPSNRDQIIPDLLVDLTYDTFLVRNDLHPKLVATCFNLRECDYTVYPEFTVFPNMRSGGPLMALIYYINVFRGDVAIRQLTENVNFLKLFQS